MAKNQIIKAPSLPSPEIVEKVMMQGDLSGLTVEQRLAYYKSVCETLSLNPLTKPFDYITLDGKLVLYARKDATEQLRKQYQISCTVTDRQQQESIYVVTARAELPGGRHDESIGATSIINKQGEQLQGTALANAVMKAETKAKRRVTLSICGLGMLDESELEGVRHVEEYDQRSESEIAERRVKQATANATGGNVVAGDKNSPVVIDDVTEDNYQDVVCHIGKDNGIKWRKVGDLNINVVDWMMEKWVGKVTAESPKEDQKLAQAFRIAHKKAHEPKDVTNTQGEKVATATPVNDSPFDVPSNTERDKLQAEIKDKTSDLIMTESQMCEFLGKQGVLPEHTTSFAMVTTDLLKYLLTNWKIVVDLVNLDKKSQPAPEDEKTKRKGRALKSARPSK